MKWLYLFILLLLLAVFSHRQQLGMDTLLAAKFRMPAADSYDVIVVGSDPEGIAAAVSAARNGLNTLLVDTREQVGGLFTLGWLNSLDMNYDPDGTPLNGGIFMEFFRKLEGDSFDLQTAGAVFNKMLLDEERLSVLLGVRSFAPVMEGSIIKGLKVQYNGKIDIYRGAMVIDATQDADIAYLAGAPFTMGQEDFLGDYRKMAVTLVFRLTGVDWEQVKKALQEDGYDYTGANEVSAWGFPDEMFAYQPQDPDVGVRGLNIGRQNDGSVLINALHVYHVDGLDPASREQAREKAAAELELLMPYMRQHVPGFARAKLAGLAPELYVRETRHLLAEYRLTLDDVLENKDFPDRAAFGSYPVDIQAVSPAEWGFVIGRPRQYAVPLRSLIPQKIGRLLVVGRSAGYDSLAAGSARTVPVGMAAGQSAAAAAWYGIAHDEDFRDFATDAGALAEIHSRLGKQGMKLAPFSVSTPISEHWSYPGISWARSLGVVSAGYNNNYRQDEKITAFQFANLAYSIANRLKLDYDYAQGTDQKQGLTLDFLAGETASLFNLKNSEGNWGGLEGMGIFSARTLEHLKEGTITWGAAYMILLETYQYALGQGPSAGN